MSDINSIADASAAQTVLGHSDAETTRRFYIEQEKAKVVAVAKEIEAKRNGGKKSQK